MLKESNFLKIRTAVPMENTAQVRQAMIEAGAGQQGNYAGCSITIRSIGRFLPLAGAKPTIGVVGKEQEVEEDIIEMLCHKNKVKNVIKALKKAHPYEEPMIDIIPKLEIN